ncbi:hypothetical protein pb186bvf_013817 [Paramecium bursaria]
MPYQICYLMVYTQFQFKITNNFFEMQHSISMSGGSIFNSLQSGIVKSVNLNSIQKSSNSKRLISEMNTSSFNNLQCMKFYLFKIVSVSSDQSRTRAFSVEQRPTVQRILESQSQIKTAQRQKSEEPGEGKFLSAMQGISPVQEMLQSKVSEFKYDNSNNKPTSRDLLTKSVKTYEQQIQNLQHKVTVLIEENSKLIQINEHLMIEVDQVKMAQSKNQLKQSEWRTRCFNNQQNNIKLSIINNHNRQESQLNNQQLLQSTNRTQGQMLEVQSQLRLKNEQFIQLSQKYLLKCLEMERGLQTKQDWNQKVSILLKENENLNLIVQQRLSEINGMSKELNDRNQLLEQLERQFYCIYQQDRISNWIEHQKQINIYNDTIIQLENEVTILQTQITEQNYDLSRKNNDNVLIVSNFNYKQREVKQLKQINYDTEQKWRQKCMEFEKDMKLSYSDKLNLELKQRMNQVHEEYQKAINSHSQSIQQWQNQMNQLNKQNEMLKQQNKEIINNDNEKIKLIEKNWQKEREGQQQLVKQLQNKINELSVQVQSILTENQILKEQRIKRSNTFYQVIHKTEVEQDYISIENKKQMINENKKLNDNVWKNYFNFDFFLNNFYCFLSQKNKKVSYLVRMNHHPFMVHLHPIICLFMVTRLIYAMQMYFYEQSLIMQIILEFIQVSLFIDTRVPNLLLLSVITKFPSVIFIDA